MYPSLGSQSPAMPQGLSHQGKSRVATGLFAELPGSCDPSFLQTNIECFPQSSLAFLPSSPNLAGAELAPTSLASTSWPEPKEAILSGAVAGSHYLRWSGDLLSTTSYSREHKSNKPA